MVFIIFGNMEIFGDIGKGSMIGYVDRSLEWIEGRL